MAYFALIQVSSQLILKVVDGKKRFRNGLPPTLRASKNLLWLPYVEVRPPFDGNSQIEEGPVDVVTATEATRTWTVRDKTAQETDDEKIYEVDDFFKNPRFKALLIALDKGTIVPGADVGIRAMKQAIMDQM